jgi:NAD(P)-binding Rossmann-like domain
MAGEAFADPVANASSSLYVLIVGLKMRDVVPVEASIVARATGVEQTYRLCDGVYLLGMMERGVTVYNQQVRAHNLVWSLWELHRAGKRELGRVAIVGGGVAGLTATAALLSRLGTSVSVTLFERLWDLCPLQQGADARWLHPRIYAWPDRGSRAPGASLPILNWSEGRASDVARVLTRAFGEYCEQFATRPESLAIFIGLRNFQLRASTLAIEWVGTRANRQGAFFRLGASEGDGSVFQTIILSAGFGLEQRVPSYETPSYWRNEQIAQPHLAGDKRNYVVSGYGDGALV